MAQTKKSPARSTARAFGSSKGKKSSINWKVAGPLLIVAVFGAFGLWKLLDTFAASGVTDSVATRSGQGVIDWSSKCGKGYDLVSSQSGLQGTLLTFKNGRKGCIILHKYGKPLWGKSSYMQLRSYDPNHNKKGNFPQYAGPIYDSNLCKGRWDVSGFIDARGPGHSGSNLYAYGEDCTFHN